MQEMKDTRVLSSGWENSLEKEMVTYSSILAGQRNLAGYSPRGSKELDMTEWWNTQSILEAVVVWSLV